MMLHGEGAEVNRNDPDLLHSLEDLYTIIKQYDAGNFYNMDKTGHFSIATKIQSSHAR